MATSATLVYKVTPTPPMSLNRVQTALGDIDLPTDDMANFGATLTSDTTSNDGTNATRTIVFNISSAEFADNFPTGQETSPFVDLYTTAIAGGLGMQVTVEPVVIA